MPLIRDTIDPLNEREVSDNEALDLDRMGVLLTGTRAKTPDGLRAAAVRQVTEQLEGSPVTGPAAPTAVVGVGDPAEGPPDSDSQTPGDAPENTPATTDSQES